MKKKLTPQQQRLQQEFDKMMAAHAKPLERGARAKGVTGSGSLTKSRAIVMAERGRVNREASLDTGWASTAPRQTMQYTGDAILGVSTMHKSNSVPVFSAEAATDIAKMRRN